MRTGAKCPGGAKGKSQYSRAFNITNQRRPTQSQGGSSPRPESSVLVVPVCFFGASLHQLVHFPGAEFRQQHGMRCCFAVRQQVLHICSRLNHRAAQMASNSQGGRGGRGGAGGNIWNVLSRIPAAKTTGPDGTSSFTSVTVEAFRVETERQGIVATHSEAVVEAVTTVAHGGRRSPSSLLGFEPANLTPMHMRPWATREGQDQHGIKIVSYNVLAGRLRFRFGPHETKLVGHKLIKKVVATSAYFLFSYWRMDTDVMCICACLGMGIWQCNCLRVAYIRIYIHT